MQFEKILEIALSKSRQDIDLTTDPEGPVEPLPHCKEKQDKDMTECEKIIKALQGKEEL